MGDFPPFALVVDDGDLDACCEVLSRLELDWLRASGASVLASAWPSDLLISNRPAAVRLGEIPPEQRRAATWLCVIDARAPASELDALRALGVHFVVRRARDGSLDRELLRLLFLQMAYAGNERRGSARMLCSHEVTYVVDAYRGRARLLDLSPTACRILTSYSVPRQHEMQLYLPVELDPQAPTAYPACVVRSAPAVAVEGRYLIYLILEFKLSRKLHAQLDQVVKAQARLAASSVLAPPRRDELVLQEEDRRSGTRHSYERPVAALTYMAADAPRLVRGHEISARGMRIDPTGELSIGQNVVLALYRGSEKPMLLQAVVRRDDGERGLWLAFGPVDAKDRQSLNRLLEELPALESLALGGSPGPAPVVLATIQPPSADPSERPAA